MSHGTARVLHAQLCSEFTSHWTCTVVLNLVPGIVSGTKRDCTCTPRAVVSWIYFTVTTVRVVSHPYKKPKVVGRGRNQRTWGHDISESEDSGHWEGGVVLLPTGSRGLFFSFIVIVYQFVYYESIIYYYHYKERFIITDNFYWGRAKENTYKWVSV